MQRKWRKLSNRPYRDGYKQAREIIDLGSTIAKVRGRVGFDNELEDFLNVQNNGTSPGHYELRFENLGA